MAMTYQLVLSKYILPKYINYLYDKMKTILLLTINIKKSLKRSVYTKTPLTPLDGSLNKQEDKNEKVDLTFQEAQDAHEAIITKRRAQIENAFSDLDKAEETMKGKINKSTTMT